MRVVVCSSVPTRSMAMTNMSIARTRTKMSSWGVVVPLCVAFVTTSSTLQQQQPHYQCHAFSTTTTTRHHPNLLVPQQTGMTTTSSYNHHIVAKSRIHPYGQPRQPQYSSTTFLCSSSSTRDLETTTTTTTTSSSSADVDVHDDITEVMRQESMTEMKVLLDYFDTYNIHQNTTKKTQDTTTTTTIPTTIPLLFHQPQDVANYIDHHIDTILFDCDGVLYRGTDPIPDAALTLQKLIKAQNKQIFFVTNNAASTRQQLRDKLAHLLQCPQLQKEQMIGSAYSAACYLKQTLWKQDDDHHEEEEEDNQQDPLPNHESTTSTTTKHVHVIGVQGLYDEIANLEHVQVTGGPLFHNDDEPASMSREELAAYPFDSIAPPGGVDAVVIGLDTEFTYRKLCIATVLLQRNPHAVLIATNRDAYDLVGMDSRHLPGNGALVAALEVASQRKAINVGKPSPLLASLIAQEYNLTPSRTLMVGDRLDTDVKFGLEGGMKSALVMTGCTTATKIKSLMEAAATAEAAAAGSSNLPHNNKEEQQDEPMPTVIFPHMGMMSV